MRMLRSTNAVPNPTPWRLWNRLALLLIPSFVVARRVAGTARTRATVVKAVSAVTAVAAEVMARVVVVMASLVALQFYSDEGAQGHDRC